MPEKQRNENSSIKAAIDSSVSKHTQFSMTSVGAAVWSGPTAETDGRRRDFSCADSAPDDVTKMADGVFFYSVLKFYTDTEPTATLGKI